MLLRVETMLAGVGNNGQGRDAPLHLITTNFGRIYPKPPFWCRTKLESETRVVIGVRNQCDRSCFVGGASVDIRLACQTGGGNTTLRSNKRLACIQWQLLQATLAKTKETKKNNLRAKQ